MNYIQEHSFSDRYTSSELSLEQYIPDQTLEHYPNGSIKFSVNQRCKTLQSELQQVLELNDRIKTATKKINLLENKRLSEVFVNILKYSPPGDSIWEQDSSLQTFIYSFHNAKIFLQLVDNMITRKNQKRTIEAFMKIKQLRKKKSANKQKIIQLQIKPIKNSELQRSNQKQKCNSKQKPALLLIKAIFRKKMAQAFFGIVVSTHTSSQKSGHSALTDISDMMYSGTQLLSSSDVTYRQNSSRSRQSFYSNILKEHEDLFSKKYYYSTSQTVKRR